MIRTTRRLNERGPARKLRNEINKLWDAIDSQRIASTPSVRAKRTRNGVALEVVARTKAMSGLHDIQVVKIDSVQDDTLTCYGLYPDYTPNTKQYKVAKPANLRYPDAYGDGVVSGLTWADDPEGNQKVTYTFNTNYSITERIKPYYESGNVLYIIKLMGESVQDETGTDVDWLDLNVDGRNWFIEPVATTICDNTSGTPIERTSYLARSYGNGEAH